VRTAVVSDLHLATRTRSDLLRDPAVRARLADRLAGVDEVVLLGDAVELRDRPLRAALDVAAAVLGDLGEAAGDARVVLVPGNHDHRLVHEARALRRRPARGLPLFETVPPGSGGALGRIRALLGTELVVAYPGVWLAAGVWATHGHYMDAHSAVPSLEALASVAAGAARRRPARAALTPEDYEAVLAPMYRLYFEIAQRPRLEQLADAGKALVRRVESAAGARHAAGEPGRRPQLGGGRLGTAEGEVRRPGVLPFGAVLDRLRVEAEHVVFGHTHRTGPLPADPAPVWRTRAGTRLWNTGSWVFEDALTRATGGAHGPYWPGTVLMLEDGVPRIERVLGGWAPAAVAARA
jgi:predicted phosphodiesterase